jgi:hypothetical protein
VIRQGVKSLDAESTKNCSFLYSFKQRHRKCNTSEPFIEAGLTKRVMSIEAIVSLVPEPQAIKTDSYKKK